MYSGEPKDHEIYARNDRERVGMIGRPTDDRIRYGDDDD